MQIKNQRNSEGDPHGYWEKSHLDGSAGYKGHYINGKQDGYWEWYYNSDKLWFKGNFKNGKKIGCWQFYQLDGSIATTIFYAN